VLGLLGLDLFLAFVNLAALVDILGILLVALLGTLIEAALDTVFVLHTSAVGANM
jgi:hypothetical protein